MPRRTILNIIEDILNILSKEGELSVRQISVKLKSQWETTIKALNFMKKVNLVKERKGKKTNKIERLFSLVKR
ncbi:unnamed protein product [marine sediment metagenome]|uniref:Uncharacterized protein n=1 Tax=marine sediment metagenome TaxID=412755 RepID=X1H6C3_9ZZZZ